MTGFGDQLRGFSRNTGIRFDKIVRKVCLDLVRELVLLTPVDTGLAKSNWFLGTNRVSSIETTASSRAILGCRRASRRYAQALEKLAGHSATVLLALATTGGTPTANRAGKEKKVPPPAMAFMPPAMNAPAAMIK